MINVEQTGHDDPMAFKVTIKEGGGTTTHDVTMSQANFDKLGGGKYCASACIEAAFAFLLEREPKEAILRSFDITVISRYFPEFENRIGDYFPEP